MKPSLIFTSLLVFMLTFPAFSADKVVTKTKIISTTKVEVYYFHYTRRCMTCNAVEAQTITSLASLYPTQYKSGKISFKSVNLDEDANAPLAQKCKAEGQALLVVSGAKRSDLTDKAFMYAVNKPEKLKAELKAAIDPLL